VNLYSYAGNNPIGFSDPFGLCTAADGWKDCDRMISSTQGLRVAAAARVSGEWTYSQYPTKPGDPSSALPGQRLGDCTDFVRNAVQSGLHEDWAGGPKASTAAFINGQAAGFTEVEADRAQPGDVVVKGGHAGIYTGTSASGQPRAIANNGRPSSSKNGYRDGDTGVRDVRAPFFPGNDAPRYFRPLTPEQD